MQLFFYHLCEIHPCNVFRHSFKHCLVCQYWTRLNLLLRFLLININTGSFLSLLWIVQRTFFSPMNIYMYFPWAVYLNSGYTFKRIVKWENLKEGRMNAHSTPRHSNFINLPGLIWFLAWWAILRYIQLSEPLPDAISPWCLHTGQNYQNLYYITKLLFKVVFPVYFPINDVWRSLFLPFTSWPW